MKILATVVVSFVLLSVSYPASAQRDNPRQERQSERQQAKSRPQQQHPLHVGDLAPEFTLQSLDGKSETDITQFRGERPLILFFGSYT